MLRDSCLPFLALCLLAAALPAQQSAMITPLKDNTLYMHPQGSLSNGAGPHFFAGVNANARPRRAVIAFDVAGALPAGATITSAQLQLTMDMSITGAVDLGLHPLTQDWGEGTSVAGGGPFGPGSGGGAGTASTNGDATWIHTFYPNQFWNNSGGDFVSTASATTNVSTSGQYLWGSTSQMVADVQGWLDMPATNFGWLLKGPETGPSAKRFASRENATASARPVLMVGFTTSQAQIVTTGTGCPATAGGNPFTLGTNGLPTIGNSSFALTLSDGHPGGSGFVFLAFGLAGTPIPIAPGSPCLIHLDPASLLSLFNLGVSPLGPASLDGTGAGSLPIPIPNDPGLIGQSVDAQALSAGTGGAAATSNAITAIFG